MTVALDPQSEALIQKKVDSGLYPDAATVVREALRLLEEHDRLRYLRTALAEADAQIDSGDYVEWTPGLMDELIREADELARKGIDPDPDVRP
jgi:antitoxin ParD1/3/4